MIKSPPPHLKKTIIEQIEAGLGQDDIKAVIEWLDSPLGRKCTRLEEAASTPEAYTEIENFAARLGDNPPAQDRLQLVQSLDASVGATEMMVTLSMNTQLAVATAILASLPTDGEIPFEELEKQVEQSRPYFESAFKTQVMVGFLYTYQSLTNDELEKYIGFANSEVGTKYHRVTIAGFKKAMVRASLRWGEAIGELLAVTKNQSEI